MKRTNNEYSAHLQTTTAGIVGKKRLGKFSPDDKPVSPQMMDGKVIRKWEEREK